jgi:tetratricopeptide (TPR) repeat protein
MVGNTIFLNTVRSIKDDLGQAYYQAGELAKAITEYEHIIRFDPNSRDRLLIHPKYHYRLAKLYEEKGLKDKAIEQYEKFLDLWKDADEELPEPHDARARLAKLNQGS